MLASLLDSIPDIVFFKDKQGVYIGCNPKFTELVGKRRENIIGKTDYDLFPRATAEAFRENDHIALTQQAPLHNEEWIAYPDGRRILVDTLKTSFQGPDGSVTGVLGVSRDITDRKKTEEALRESESNFLFGISKDLSAEQEAHQRFKSLFQSNPNLIAVSTLPDQRLQDVNRAFIKDLGYACEDVIGKTPAEAGLIADAGKWQAMAEQVERDGHFSDLEIPIRRRDGVLREGLMSGDVIASQGRRYLITVMTDITERKRSEREVARLLVIQRELMHLATDFVNIPLERQNQAIDESLAIMGRLIEADRSYLFTYNFDRGVMSNTHEWCEAGITPEIANLQDVPNEAMPDWVAAHRNGELVHIPSVAALSPDLPLRRILDPQGIQSLITLPLMAGSQCLGFVGFDAVREARVWGKDDIALLRVLAELYAHFEMRRASERQTRELEKKLMQARDAAQEAARSKTLFLANMSHEIRTPLNAILGYAQIMEQGCIQKACPMGQKITAITRSGNHLLNLITDLLELVRNDAQMVSNAATTFDLAQTLEDIRLMVSVRPETQNIAIETALDENLPRLIHADEGKIRQILTNLVDNAVKFTPAGSIRLHASLVESGEAECQLAVEVSDTGHGIRQEELPLLFDLFAQTESGRKRGEGTGLGLPLSRRYARFLGGDITVISKLDEGSCFRFTFKARLDRQRANEAPVQYRIRLAPECTPCRILVVDDDAPCRDMLKTMLTGVGFEVEEVANANAALKRLEKPPAFGLIMMDKRMPGLDGLDAIRLIRQLPNGRDFKILMVSASGFTNQKEEALEAGADGHICKPVKRTLLLEEIGRTGGLRYVYENRNARPAAPKPATDLPDEALRILPPERREALGRALRRGDIRLLRELAAATGAAHPDLAVGLKALVDTYKYNRLQQLLDQAGMPP